MIAVEPFCGAGGMAIGLARAGFECVWAGDMDKDAVAAARQVVPAAEVARLDPGNAAALGTRLRAEHGEVDLLAAGVPCQPFSAAGKGRGQWDPRDGFPAFLALVEALQPRAVLIENVRGLTFAKHRPYLEAVAEALAAHGYTIPYAPLASPPPPSGQTGFGFVGAPRLQSAPGLIPGRVCNAADWAVPQRRERIFIVAFRDPAAAARFEWPEPTHSEAALVWAKWGEGVRGGIEGGSYWAEHGLAGPTAIDAHAYARRARPTREAGDHSAPGALKAQPAKREARVLQGILAGRIAVRGLPWRTVRSAIADLAGLLSADHVDGTGHLPQSQRPMTADAPAASIQGGSGGDRPGGSYHGQMVRVIGAGGNPHGPGAERERERNRRDITDEPAPVMAAEQIGNRGPWVANHEAADARPAPPGDVIRYVNQSASPHVPDGPAMTVRGLGGKGPELLAAGGWPPRGPSGEVVYPPGCGRAGSEPGRLDAPAPSVSGQEVKGTRASASSGYTFHGGPDRASDATFLATGLRRLSVREAARLQDFPDDHVFHGTKTSQYRCVGNACPPALAEVVACAIKKVLGG